MARAVGMGGPDRHVPVVVSSRSERPSACARQVRTRPPPQSRRPERPLPRSTGDWEVKGRSSTRSVPGRGAPPRRADRSGRNPRARTSFRPRPRLSRPSALIIKLGSVRELKPGRIPPSPVPPVPVAEPASTSDAPPLLPPPPEPPPAAPLEPPLPATPLEPPVLAPSPATPLEPAVLAPSLAASVRPASRLRESCREHAATTRPTANSVRHTREKLARPVDNQTKTAVVRATRQ